jgi:hypothetical protein
MFGRVFTLTVVLAFATSSQAAQQWLRASTPNFELYTDENEARARDTILYFEQVRAFFAEATQSKRAPVKAIRIVGFRSEKDFAAFSPGAGAAAYYQAGDLRDHIVMLGLGSDHYEAAVHEYVHLMIYASGLPPPLWLNEGLAQLYSSLKASTRDATIGAVDRGRLAYLTQNKLLDLYVLAAVDRESPFYNDPEKMQLFYAESWALTHMLALADDYRPKFTDFLAAAASGSDLAQALNDVYGRSPGKVQGDLLAYIRQSSFKGYAFSFGVVKPALQAEIRNASPLESGLVLAGLQASQPSRQNEARVAYEKLASEYPRSWEPAAGLAYLALRSRSAQEAERRFARAVELGCDDAKLFFDYATFTVDSDAKKRAALLRKAVELKPGYDEARLYLGFASYEAEDFPGARDALQSVKQVPPEQAASYFLALAFSSDRLGLREEAKIAAQRALDAARGEADKDSARRLLEYLSQSREVQSIVRADVASTATDPPVAARRTPAPARPSESVRPEPATLPSVTGSLQQVDCLGETARLWVETGGHRMAFMILNPNDIVIWRGGEPVTLDFSCGPQKPQPVVIQYEKSPDSKLNAQGVVRVLEFR